MDRIARISLRAPIWDRKKPSLGVAEFRIKGSEIVEVKVTYRDKKGNFVYPGRYRIPTAKAMTYPVKIVSFGTKLRVIPIVDFPKVI